MNTSNLKYGSFEPEYVVLAQSPKSVLPFASASALKDASKFTSGDKSSSSDIFNLIQGYSVPFYVLENAQGVLLPDNDDPWAKVPENISNADCCTYLSLKGTYKDKSGGLIATHTFKMFLGKDNITNFDILRNTTKTLTLTISDDGFLKGSWKVERDIVSDTRTMAFEQDSYEVSYNTPVMAKLITSGNIGVNYSLSQNLLDAGVAYDATTRTLSQSVKLDADVTGTLTATSWDLEHTATAQVTAKKYEPDNVTIDMDATVTLYAGGDAEVISCTYPSSLSLSPKFPDGILHQDKPVVDNGETVTVSYSVLAELTSPFGIRVIEMVDESGVTRASCTARVKGKPIWDGSSVTYVAQKKTFSVPTGCSVYLNETFVDTPAAAALTFVGTEGDRDRYSFEAYLPSDLHIMVEKDMVDNLDPVSIMAPTLQISSSSIDLDITAETCAGLNHGSLSYSYLDSMGKRLYDKDFDPVLFDSYLRPEVTAKEGSPEFANTHSCFSVSVGNLFNGIDMNVASLKDSDGKPLPFTNYANRDAMFWFRPPYMKIADPSIGDKGGALSVEVRAMFGDKDITKYFSDGYDMPETYVLNSPVFEVISDDMLAEEKTIMRTIGDGDVLVSDIGGTLYWLAEFSSMRFSYGWEYAKISNTLFYSGEPDEDFFTIFGVNGAYEFSETLVAELEIGGARSEYSFGMEFVTSDAITRLYVGHVTYVTPKDITSVRCPVMGQIFRSWSGDVYDIIPQDAVIFRLTLNDSVVYDYWWRAGYGMGYMELPVGTTDYGLVLNTSKYNASDGGILVSDNIWVGIIDFNDGYGNSDPFTCYGSSYTSHVGYEMALAN